MPNQIKDRTGQRYGKLVVLSFVKRDKQKDETIWLCKCDCGTIKEVDIYDIVSKRQWNISCGCSQAETLLLKNNKIAQQYIGQKYHKLTILSRDKDKIGGKNPIYFICKCDCGNLTSVSRSNLLNGSTKSCGCAIKEGAVKYFNSIKNTATLEPGYNSLISSYKKNAQSRNLDWNLSKEDCKKLFNDNCHYCNQPPSNIKNIKRKCFPSTQIKYNGIDRVNNNKGYLLDNCVSCCQQCNEMKMARSLESFLTKIKDIYNFNKLYLQSIKNEAIGNEIGS